MPIKYIITICTFIASSISSAASQSLTHNWQTCRVSADLVQDLSNPDCTWNKMENLQYLPNQTGTILFLKKTLPKTQYHDPALFLKVRYSFVVYIDKQHIFQHGNIFDETFTTSNVEHAITIPKDSAKKELLVAISSSDIKIGINPKAIIGENQSILSQVFQKMYFSLTIGLFYFIFGVFLSLFYFLDRIFFRSLLAGGILSLLHSVWTIQYSGLATISQLNVLDSLWVKVMQHWAMFLWHVPFLFMLKQMYPTKKMRPFFLGMIIILACFYTYAAYVTFTDLHQLGQVSQVNRLLGLLLSPIFMSLFIGKLRSSHSFEKIAILSFAATIAIHFWNCLNFLVLALLPRLNPEWYSPTTNEFWSFFRQFDFYRYDFWFILALVFLAVHEVIKGRQQREKMILTLKEANLELSSIKEQLIQNETYKHIASMTQMFAHDVRRPFTLLKSALNLLENKPKLDKNLIQRLNKEVSNSMSKTSQMLEDVLSITTTKQLKIEVLDLNVILHQVIQETFIDNKYNMYFKYNLQHTKGILGDDLKTQRICSNLLENAAQALNLEGTITIESHDITVEKTSYVSISVINAGALIPRKDIDVMFNPFFSSKRKSGTGLGLAICKKFVEQQSGSISCKSTPDHHIQFTFILPSANRIKKTDVSLPRTSKQIRKHFSGEAHHAWHELDITKLTKELMAFKLKKHQKFSMIILDDDATYASMILEHIYQSSLDQYIDIHLVTSPSEFYASKFETKDLYIIDYDLNDTQTGLTIISFLRECHALGFICLHSNHGFLNDELRLSAQADIFLPKPMAKNHLLHLISAALRHDYEH